ncbi:hypothetical protein CN380_12510 [Bacillus sp. AFS017274]|nr:hypothetical protein CN380_12510 [Bacillus sp. AFS017274]
MFHRPFLICRKKYSKGKKLRERPKKCSSRKQPEHFLKIEANCLFLKFVNKRNLRTPNHDFKRRFGSPHD